jgi:hypothetical protein
MSLLEKLGFNKEKLETMNEKAKREAFRLATGRFEEGDVENFLREAQNKLGVGMRKTKELVLNFLSDMEHQKDKMVTCAHIRRAAHQVGFTPEFAEELAYYYFVQSDADVDISETEKTKLSYDYILGCMKSLYEIFRSNNHPEAQASEMIIKRHMMKLL